MNVDFNNISEHVIPMENFSLKWRFTEKNYNILPKRDLDELKPLNKQASRFLWEYMNNIHLLQDFPFKKGLFTKIDKAVINENNKEIKDWLSKRGLTSKQEVIISWNSDTAMILPWNLLIKYFNDFYYPNSDDVTVIDSSNDWALLFHHTDIIYWAQNVKFNQVSF